MRKLNEENERTKRAYIRYLEETKGKDNKTTDKVLAALLEYDESTNFKSFKKFHIDDAVRFKRYLDKAKNARTGKPLSHSTIDATLRLVKAFFVWLVRRTGFKKVLSYADCEYFNNTAKKARIAHTQRDIPYPSMEQARHAFQAMPNVTDFEKRDKAAFALFMLTGIRDGAAASLRLKHINLDEGEVFQDAREVKTKNGKTIYSWFFPVDDVYRPCFEDWVRYLRSEKLFGPSDALFPKALMSNKGGGFVVVGLSRKPYANASKLNQTIRNAFAMVQLHEYTPHSFRKTLFLYADEVCTTMQEKKAWSMNLGHENLATSINAYMPVDRNRQRDLIRGLGRGDLAA